MLNQYEPHQIAGLLREIFHPFGRVPLSPSVRAWHDRLIERMAENIYAEEAWEQLGVFGDALEDAGYGDASVLAHLRSPGPHVRGCWAVDLVLRNV